eukprot:CAMPEP_0177772580 /NCGR_PEP_ID=MMETSP0491_2-20121128/12322_1 /TAXON_ID=63592 /ORGANISM="Tetraselmis chuii, Strain PLY429" /LENGTH=718 /DNA_ID=CAMNT_0019290447 /DNA_START=601 /DNA_END=2758 /DNA_ORIENTATION=+
MCCVAEEPSRRLASRTMCDTCTSPHRIAVVATRVEGDSEARAALLSAQASDGGSSRGGGRAAEGGGYPPLWLPTAEGAAETNVGRFMATKFQGGHDWESCRTGDPRLDFPKLQMLSYDQPELFWPQVLEELRVKFHRKPSRILSPNRQNPDEVCWLPDATMNIAESCIVGRDPDAAAVVWAKDGSPRDVHYISVGQLHQQICHVASSLRAMGLRPGDSVAVCMPMTARAVSLYLGIVWAGCAVVGVADSFAKAEVATRVRVAGASAMFTQDVIPRGGRLLPLYSKLAGLRLEHGTIVVPAVEDAGLQAELRPEDTPWAAFAAMDPTAGAALTPPHIDDAQCVSNILFSSGTTGEPKAIPWTHVTPIRCAVDGWGHQDVRAGEVVVWPTNLGWMMGPWLIYASLLNGAAIGLYEGSPLGRDFGEFIASARVSMLGLVPSMVKAWRSSGCMAGLDWGCIRRFSSTGEASNADDYHWLMARAGYKPVVEYCGGTEIGGGFLAGSLLLPARPGMFSTPTLGCRLTLITDAGRLSQHGLGEPPAVGELAINPPMLGSSQRLLNRDHFKVYYEGMPRLTNGQILRRHGDVIRRYDGGSYAAQGRCDDTMNLGGIKISSVEIERACMAAGVEGVLDVAAVGVSGTGGGPEKLVVFCVRNGTTSADELRTVFSEALKQRLNPLFKVSAVVIVSSLPRTATNKVMRRVLRDTLKSAAPNGLAAKSRL